MNTKWKINSIRYAQRILILIGILTIAAPITFYLCFRLLGLIEINSAGLLIAIRISVAIGMVLLALFILLLLIESVQDRLLNAYYLKIRNRRLRLAGGYYECPYCGSRKVRAADRRCPACYKDLL